MIVFSSSLQPPQQAGANQTKEAEEDKNVSVTNGQPLFSLEDCDAIQVNLLHTFDYKIHHWHLI